MNNLIALTRRNILLFFRTKSNILFATLSVIIIIALHFLVLQDMFTQSWVDVFASIPGMVIEEKELQWIVDSMIFAAIIPMGSITISLVTLGQIVNDNETNALNDYMVAPIKRNSLLISYLLSSFIVGFLLLIVFVLLFEFYFLIIYGVSFTFAQFGYIILVTLFSLLFANVFMLLLISFIKRNQILGALGTILGTLIGFISGAYIPVGQFGSPVGDIISTLPFLQLTVLARQSFLLNITSATSMDMDMLSGELAKSYGIELWIGDSLIPTWSIILMVFGFVLILLICLIIRFARMKKKN